MVECDGCEEGNSTVFCHGCKLNLCAKCNEEQHKVPKFRKHVREQLVNNDQVDQQIGKCTEHNAFYSFYCDACDKFVCLEECCIFKLVFLPPTFFYNNQQIALEHTTLLYVLCKVTFQMYFQQNWTQEGLDAMALKAVSF